MSSLIRYKHLPDEQSIPGIILGMTTKKALHEQSFSIV